MTFFNSIRSSGIDPLVISGGDFLYKLADYKQVGNPLYRAQMEAKAQLITHAYNLFGYDVAAVGECDLVFGLDSLLKIAAKMKFPLLCANLVKEEDGSLIFHQTEWLPDGTAKQQDDGRFEGNNMVFQTGRPSIHAEPPPAPWRWGETDQTEPTAPWWKGNDD